MKKRDELASYPALDDMAPIDVEEARRALEKVRGNISAAAELLNVHSARLRAFVAAEPLLRRMQEEIMERAVDRAIEILHEGMKDQHYSVRLQASKELLRTRVASMRGFGPQAGAIDLPTPGQTITIKWLGDEDPEPKDDPKLIEGEKIRH
jgi:hypothetical protein